MVRLWQEMQKRWRAWRSRSRELRNLRRRFRRESPRHQLTAEERQAADEMKALRALLPGLVGSVRSCAGCAKGCPLPHGRWDGGFCCSGQTDAIFSDLEIAALRASGVSLSALRPPRADHAGCAFRGPTGCSLPPAHRPNLCLIYLCRDLTHELASQGRLDSVEEAIHPLKATLARFAQARQTRLEREEVAAWEAELNQPT